MTSTNRKIIFFLSTFCIYTSSLSSNIDNTPPFENNLRIMSFSNMNEVVGSRKYHNIESLVSMKGIDQFPILGGKEIKESFGVSNSDVQGGGMVNLAKLIEIKRREVNYSNTIVLDAGGSLASLKGASINHNNLMSLHIDMGVDVMSIGKEIELGAEHVRYIASEYGESSISVLSANLIEGDSFLFNPFKEFKIGDHKIVVVGYSNEYKNKFEIIEATRDLSNLKDIVGYFSKDNYFIILLSANDINRNIEIATEVPGINIIVGGSDLLSLPHPIFIHNDLGTTGVITSGSGGDMLSVLDINLDGEKLDEFRYNAIQSESKYIEEKTSDYTFFYNLKDFKYKKIQEVSEDLVSGGVVMGNLDELFLSKIFSHHKPDLIIGDAPEAIVSVSKEVGLYDHHIFNYFGNGRNRFFDTYILGSDLLKKLTKAVNSMENFSNNNFISLRTMGISFDINYGDEKNTVVINKVNNKKFSATNNYKLVGWGDSFINSKNGPFVDKIIISLFD